MDIHVHLNIYNINIGEKNDSKRIGDTHHLGFGRSAHKYTKHLNIYFFSYIQEHDKMTQLII